MNHEYIDIFKEKETLLKKASPSFMIDIRHNAIESFGKTGLPDTKNELYKYTPMQKIFEPDYSMLFQPSKVDLKIDEIFTCDVPNLNVRLEVILNGFYFKKDSGLTKLENGILIGSLAEAIEKGNRAETKGPGQSDRKVRRAGPGGSRRQGKD